MFVVIPGLGLFGWIKTDKPLINSERNYLEIYLQNSFDSGDLYLEMDYIVDLEKSLRPIENISGGYSLAKKVPFKIEFETYTNITIILSGLSENQCYWSSLNGEAYNLRYYDELSVHWFLSEYPVECERFSLYIDGAITHPETMIYGLNIDTKYVNKAVFNHTFDIKQEVNIINADKKSTHIESSNVRFLKERNRYTGNSFEDIIIERESNNELEFVTTNIDFDFSTGSSRFFENSKLIILAIIIELPLLKIIDLLKGIALKQYNEKERRKYTLYSAMKYE